MSSHKLNTRVFELTGEAALLVTVPGSLAKATILCASTAFCDAVGLTYEKMVGKDLSMVMGLQSLKVPLECEKRQTEQVIEAIVEVKTAAQEVFESRCKCRLIDDADAGDRILALVFPDWSSSAAHRSATAPVYEQPPEQGPGSIEDLTSRLAQAEDDRERLIAGLNSYQDPFVIYSEDLELQFWNDAYAASFSDLNLTLRRGMHLREVLEIGVAAKKFPAAIGNEEAWINHILSKETLNQAREDVEVEGDAHYRLLRSRAPNGDYVVIRLNSTELVQQKRAAEAAQDRLLAALNAYPSPFAIYDRNDRLVVWNTAYAASMTSDPSSLKVGMHRNEIARAAIVSGKIAEAAGREQAWLSFDHLEKDAAKPIQDLELENDVHHRLLRTRTENGDLMILRIDMTELVRQRRKLEETQNRLISAINAYPDPFAIYSADHKLMIWNPAFTASMTDNPEDIYEGIHLKDLLKNAAASGRIPAASGQEDTWVDSYYRPDVLDPGVEDFEFSGDQHFRMVRSRAENGEFVVLRLNITEVVRQRRAVERYAQELERANREITYKALHDELTGLGNRRYLSLRFEDLVAKRRKSGGELAVLHVDLDHFKQINDTMGHAAGDRVLVESAIRICECTGADDIVARIGGDEFVVLVAMAQDSSRPEDLAQKILQSLATPIPFEGKECRLTASIGIARTPLADVDELLTNSDVALYKAKRRGRRQLGVFDKSDLAELRENKALADDLLRAVDRREFVPFYQPQVNAVTGAVVGMEALARWDHPQRGILSPAAFLSLATDLNLAADIDRMIFETALSQCQDSFSSFDAPPTLSFNVSARRISDDDINDIGAQIKTYAGEVSFELLETIFLEEEEEEFLFQLDRLRDLGIAIEVDDFGSGRASVVALQRIGPDRIKIDRRLVEPVATSQSGFRLVQSMVEIGNALGMGVTAEGVETREQADILAELGCDRLQGFFFARPMPFAELERFMSKTHGHLSQGAR